MKKAIKYFYYVCLFFICFEIALLILGYRRYINVSYNITSTPSYCLIPHAKLGFGLKPGNFNVTINKGFHYKTTHNQDSLRTTGKALNDTSYKVFFFGCSYTYGMGVNDDENFVSLFQQKHPNLNVKNFGVPGYGTIQSLLQLQSIIKKQDIPNTVIINYANFHDIRNGLTPQYRLNLKMGYEQANDSLKQFMQSSNIPFVRKENNGFIIDYCNWKNIYNNWWLRESLASVNYVQTFIDKQTEKKIPTQQITLFIFDEIKKLCDNHNINLIVTGITKNKETEILLEKLNYKGINILDISVDLENKNYNNSPYDNHPNEFAHSLYANSIDGYFTLLNPTL